MAVGCGNLATMGVPVHRSQGVQEAPHAGAQECHDSCTHGPQHRGLVRVVAAATVDHVEGEDHHHEERKRFQCREHRTQPEPVLGRPDPEEVVPGTDDAGNQRHGDDHVQPLLDYFAVYTCELDQHIGQNGTHDQFPHAFYPQVDHKPPEVLVGGQVAGVVEGEQPQYGQAYQAGDQYDVDHGLAAFQRGHGDVIEERHHDHGDTDLGYRGLLQELPAHGG